MIDNASLIARLASGQFFGFPGGVHPVEQKYLSNGTPIARIPLADKYYVPLRHRPHDTYQLLVRVGDLVLKGQPLTTTLPGEGLPIHAPTSGTVMAIQEHASNHASGLPEECVVIEADGADTQWHCEASGNKEDIVETLRLAGIAGMGGAGFPTYIKTQASNQTEFLIVNGVECEPYISSDDRLMREHASTIVAGIQVLQKVIMPQQVIIALEDNKPEAFQAMQQALRDLDNIQLVSVPTKYPSGGEKQLIENLLGRQVPANGKPIDVGVLMFNVATCFAVARAIEHGEPLIERVVTVTGKAVRRPGNYWVPIGTAVEHLLAHCGYNPEQQPTPKVIMGGPMMGVALHRLDAPVTKITNCLLVPAGDELAPAKAEQPCIRCGACADACPATLLPQQLLWYSKAKEWQKAEDYHLFDCIECGACAYVCPSDIPLVQYYRQAKAEIRIAEDERRKAEKARERFEARKLRLEQEKLAREEKFRQAQAARAQTASAPSGDAKDKVAAAIARAKAKKMAQAAGEE